MNQLHFKINNYGENVFKKVNLIITFQSVAQKDTLSVVSYSKSKDKTAKLCFFKEILMV